MVASSATAPTHLKLRRTVHIIFKEGPHILERDHTAGVGVESIVECFDVCIRNAFSGLAYASGLE